MSTIAACADVHIGNHRRFGGRVEVGANRRARHALDMLASALERARQEGASVFVVAGDLLDYVRPEAQLLAAVQRLFRDARSHGLQVVLLRGNHECVTATEGDNALAPLASDVDLVVEKPQGFCVGDDVEIAFVPFQPGGAMVWLPKAVSEAFGGEAKPGKGKLRVLVLHLGIADDDTPQWLRNAQDAVQVSALEDLCKRWRIAVVLAGNWHNRQRWTLCGGRTVVQQIGALCPTGWDNPGFDGYGGLAVLRTGGKWKLDVCDLGGPRFIKCSAGDFATLDAAAKWDGPTYLQVIAPIDSVADALHAVNTGVEQGALTAAEVLPDPNEVAAAARSAATAARSADTLNDALASYVQEMPLPDEVDREEVLARARRYLAGVDDA